MKRRPHGGVDTFGPGTKGFRASTVDRGYYLESIGKRLFGLEFDPILATPLRHTSKKTTSGCTLASTT